ncbi:MAG TPA: hypothetical protein PLA68_03270 [Panacibacter sp.]|nr:hypothetical protein [Panacibacter sp.]
MGIVKYLADPGKMYIKTALKKGAAILLLILFVFNGGGYRVLISYMQHKEDAEFVTYLDNENYNEEDLVEVKVPLNVPYQSNWKNYERVNGEINLNGQVYNYVKRKVYNDTMIFLCIRHETKTELQQIENDYFGKINDLSGNDNNKKALIYKQTVSDFDSDAFINIPAFHGIARGFNLHNDAFLKHLYIPVHGHPPKHFA